MKRLLLTSLVLLQFAALALPVRAAAVEEFDEIIARYRGLLASGYTTVNQTGAWDAANAAAWVNSLAADGRWPDIDYENRAGGAWLTLGHLRRVRVLAKEFADKKSKHYRDPQVEHVVLRALDHWTTQRYQNPNWWQNQIGVPQVMRDIIVLLDDDLKGESREGAMAVLHQAFIGPDFNGANLVWSAELVLMAAALEKDAATLTRTSELIAKEVAIGGEQGIQSDYSFHQHGARLQQFHYGASFFQDTVRIAWLLRGTQWAFAEEKVRLLADYAERGNFWMSRGGVTVPGTLDRAVSRPGAMQGVDMNADLFLLSEVFPERRAELKQMARVQAQGFMPAHTGFQAFPRSDFTVYHQSRFSFFLKTISTRTEVTETLLRENRRGKKLNWGDHYVLTQFSNYVDLPPVWDWELLPGVTSATDLDTIQRSAFVGSIGDIWMGASVMDYAVGKGEATTLTARKFWAMHGDVVIGLIGDLNRPQSGETVRTALDQRRLKGAVSVADARGVTVLENGKHVLSGVRWIHHDGLLYVPLGGEPVSFSLGPVIGSWNDVNLNYSTDLVTESIFLATLEHGAAPANVASGFVIRPCESVATAKKLMKKTEWTVLQNNTAAQAVRFGDGSIMAALYAPGKISLGAGRELQVDQACLLMISNGELRASDPTQQGKSIEARLGDHRFTVVCPAGGTTSAPQRLKF